MKPTEAVKAQKSLFHRRLEEAWETGVNFFNGRNTREKVMILALAACSVVFLDYWALIHPVVTVFQETLPNVAALESEVNSYRSDQKNQDKIKQEWAQAKDRMAEAEKSFVAPDGLSALLENLSKLAQGSGVKIIALTTGEPEEAGQTRRYTRVPIRLSAVASAHHLGEFLARLESGQTFFKVVDLEIKAQPSDAKRHSIETTLQIYRRSA